MERLKTQKEMQYPRKQRWNVDLDPAQENMGSDHQLQVRSERDFDELIV